MYDQCVWWSYGDCYIEYMWVNIRCMLDWILGFGQKTAEIHFFGMRAQLLSAQNETLLWLAVSGWFDGWRILIALRLFLNFLKRNSSKVIFMLWYIYIIRFSFRSWFRWYIFLKKIVTNSEERRKKVINMDILIRYCIFRITYNTAAVGFSNFRSHYGLKLYEW